MAAKLTANALPLGNPETWPSQQFARESTVAGQARAALEIPDHELLRCIGRGSYGEVWLARNVLGEFRAVKVVYRKSFEHERPYDREFEGIQKFEPISRLHNSQVDILHVGRNQQGQYFYYVMELADDATTAGEAPRAPSNDGVSASAARSPIWTPQTYVPHTLKLDLHRRGRLPVDECISIGLALTTALEHLHSHGLVHRDVKPSNIIFINAVPKLADIGLVASMDATMSFVGTSGFLPPEGPGTPQADLYSLGKVLYEISTGWDRSEFPKLPPNLTEFEDPARLLELNAVIVRACAPEVQGRYDNAGAMLADLSRLRDGKSVRRARRVERGWRLFRRGAGALAVGASVAVLIGVAGRIRQPHESGRASQRSTNSIANDEYDKGRSVYRRAGDSESAVPHFQAAINADPNFLLAQSALAMSLCIGHQFALRYDQFPRLTEAFAVAQRVLARDDNLSGAHLAVAWHAVIREHNWKNAVGHFEKAIRCDPNDWEPHEWYGSFLSAIGQTNQAIRELEIASQLGGSEPDVNEFFGQVLFAARRYSEAAEKYQKAIEMPEQDKTFHHWQLARALLWRDRTDQAMERWVEATYGAKEAWVSDLKRVLQQQGQTAFWNKRLEEIRQRTKDPLILADACAMAGRTTEALDLLEQAYNERHDFLVLRLKTEPEWDSLRREPRFEKLLRLLRLSEY